MGSLLWAESPGLMQVISSLQSAAGGWDFSLYSPASMERQLQRVLEQHSCRSMADLARRIGAMNPEQRRKLCDSLTVNVTELFRDPDMFSILAADVFPYLAEFPRIKIWLAGCAVGDEAYSLAILLAEHGLLSRSQIVATDLCFGALQSARSGVIDGVLSKECAARYRLSGGRASLMENFSCQYGVTKLNQELLRNIHFIQHGLPSQAPVHGAQLVLCRNVLIYFNSQLKDRCLGSLCSSLSQYGHLVLGPKETLEFSPFNKYFTLIAGPQQIYKADGVLPNLASR